jgi:two-component system phosphate regulon response regulator PhoB/two-component system alkaline phosphatase synthesis response regulator PhoP
VKHIAIVEDEPDIVELVSLHLTRAGFRVSSFADASAFVSFLQRTRPQLVILDLMLPDMDGLDVCKYLRGQTQFQSIPVIMLTARTNELDRVLGLELGADDYVTKPFSVSELVARVKAVLRRGTATDADPQHIQVGDMLTLDLNRYETKVQGRTIKLTPTEFRVLQLLASKQGWVFTRDQILDHLWGEDKIVLDRTVDVHVKHLRDKLGPAAGFLQNVRGIGYKLEA